MDRILKFVFWLLLAVALVLGALVLYDRLSRQYEAPAEAGLAETGAAQTGASQTGTVQTETPALDPAPDFTVYDGEGNAVSRSDYLGTPMVINVWASWCGPCKNEMPHFQEAYEAYGSELQFLMVNLTGSSDTREPADQLIADNGYTFPVFYDMDNSAALAMGVYSIPVTIVVDAAGNLAGQHVGMLSQAGLEELIALVREPA